MKDLFFNADDFESILPVRDGDCPAATLCEALGNIDESCLEGGRECIADSKRCLASIVLMHGLHFGMIRLEKVQKIVEEKRSRIGFLRDVADASRSRQEPVQEDPLS